MKKFLLFFISAMMFVNICTARVSDTINPNEGYSKYSGWIYADMTFNKGIISEDAAYSMRIYRDFGLIPVAYCAGSGNNIGTYTIFYVNPYHNCLIVGKTGVASHGYVYSTKLNAFEHTGDMIYYTDMGPYQDMYRKAINVAKKEFANYQAMSNI